MKRIGFCTIQTLFLCSALILGPPGCSDDDSEQDKDLGVDAGIVDSGGTDGMGDGAQPDACPPTDEPGVFSFKKPPTSMDQYYHEDKPSDYLMAMFAMEGPLGAMGTYMTEGEMTKAVAAWEAFKTEYDKVSKMVPEWSDQFPQQPVDDFDQALQSGDPAMIGPAMGMLGKVCGDCHHTNMPAVWFNYAFKDVEEINIDDPVGGQSLSWEDYMHGLSGLFSATDTYLKEAETSGDFTKALSALGNFKNMLEGLKEGCKECHGQEDERRYFVDADIFGLLTQAEAELGKGQPDMAVVGQALQGVGGGTCYPCHVVHLPAAAVKHAWSEEPDPSDACHEPGVFKLRPPPTSMDQYYHEDKPSDFLMAMFAMEGPLGAMGTYMQEGEMAKAAAAWEAFKTEYDKVSKMVPEWSDQFPQQPIDDLDQALQSGDPAMIGPAMGGLGKVCGDCHHTNMPAVWYNYVYKDVEEINIDDPVGGQPLSWEDYMHGLSGLFSATDTYLKEAETSGDFTKALQALSGFSQMLEGLKEGCKECHGQQDERRYFVDADIFGLLSQAEAELAKSQPDLAVIGQALQGVGGGSCYPCHVTHLPAAAVKHAWNPEEGH